MLRIEVGLGLGLGLGFGFGFGLVFVLVWIAWVYAGIRDLALRWHPRDVSALQASPLCGAAPTFLCRRKEK
ncbi:hypothetical protein VOI32_38285 [Paraburkholderia caribensis]|uniref:Transmembrane protein n=1 Tax=Paraburkholderia caribensis TaxID=75105 RepID=A0ABV0E8G0_9BURK|nr:hypothetical protein [Paraburkholderia caribensis]MCO4882523.1 hypothetical protein [Paraburkholderia caribensis]